MTNQQAPEIYALHTVPNEGKKPWFGIYAVRADAEHDAKVLRDATGRDWSVGRLVVADTAATPTGPITRYEVVDCIDSKHAPAVIPNGAGPWVRYEDHAAALCRLHAENEALRATHVQNPAEIEHVADDVSKNGAEVNTNVYAELPPRYYLAGGVEKTWDQQQMCVFADATHALRAQQPAPATQQVGEVRRAELVPGVMHCAKCKFQLNRVTLCVSDGNAYAGNNKTEPCPNGCGPLWPVTWEQEAKNCWKALEEMHERLMAAAAPQPPTAQAASSAVLKAIREANMQLVRTGDNAFMLVPYKVATAQAAESVPAVDVALEVADAMADSQYLAGVSAGWNAANADDPNAALQKLHESRAGYLKPLLAARAPADSVTAPVGGETYHLGACIVEDMLHATVMRKEPGRAGAVTVLLSEQIPVEHLQDRDVIVNATPPAQAADSVLEDAEQHEMDAKHAAIYRWMLGHVADVLSIFDNWLADEEADTDELHDALAARAAQEGK